ncbi:hypothetical protein DN546_37480, partial [Burkholderia multivorans]
DLRSAESLRRQDLSTLRTLSPAAAHDIPLGEPERGPAFGHPAGKFRSLRTRGCRVPRRVERPRHHCVHDHFRPFVLRPRRPHRSRRSALGRRQDRSVP